MDSVQAHYVHVMLKQYYVLTTCIATDKLFTKPMVDILLKRKSEFVHVFSECFAVLQSCYPITSKWLKHFKRSALLEDKITKILKNQNAAINIQYHYNADNTVVNATDARIMDMYNALTNYFQPIKAELLHQIASFIDSDELDLFNPDPGCITSDLIDLLNFLETIFTFTLTNDVTKHFGLPVFFTCNSL